MEATGIHALDTVLVWGGVISVLAGVGTVAWRAVRTALHLGGRAGQFFDDWYGEEGRPGVPARPGVMERVAGIEDWLTRVEHELYPNSGGSLRDAVDLANERLSRLSPDPEPDNASPDPPPVARPYNLSLSRSGAG
ncbi:hypothetical protein [Streptomyces brasiliensis]|uniref:Uncharacterized protein n=1 Tax=Streptomyces brasiliensis TaxID=1954 RepID=A0A917PEB4_9ACTN|nr:hypothetical protein [Streptomyces brasiliensis]GGJ72872.1 hypothetical protein GCM10010121_099330 [Streptomyces brasiliensis]